MNSAISFIPYYRELLLLTSPLTIKPIRDGVPTRSLQSLGAKLGFDSIRLFIANDLKHTFEVYHIYGNKSVWDSVSLRQIKRSIREFDGRYKDYYYFEMKHFREKGSFVILGYLACHCSRSLFEEEIKGLDVYCILLGTSFVRRLASAQNRQTSRIISSLLEVPTKWQLPGTIITKTLRYLHKLGRFNFGAYCTVYNTKICVEYCICNNASFRYINPEIIDVDTNFIHDNIKYHSESIPFSTLPDALRGALLKHDNRSYKYFTSEIRPVCIDKEVVGVWIFSFSKNNPYSDADLVGVLSGLTDQLNNSYKFLFQRRFKSMIVNPIFKCRDTRLSDKTVFVIMPFTQDWSNDLWEEVLKPTITESDLIPIRADDLYGANIMEDVWQSILKAELIICDTTGRNPNVFYELGIAHTLGKKVILLTQNINDIPFDLQSYRHIQYSLSISGGNQLKQTLKRYIKETLLSI